VIAIGLMSGTSLDGVDAALVELRPRADGYDVRLLRFLTKPFDENLTAQLLAALPPRRGGTAEIAALGRRLGEAFAGAARAVLQQERVDYVASHGQTLWYDAASHTTLQLGDAFVIREAIGATVCYDFRSADCAAGGTGAPLAPYVDALLLRSAYVDRAALNIGGIANVTALPKSSHQIFGFDTGPGNMLIDAFIRERTSGTQRFDRDGALASQGIVDESLLEEMLRNAYFAMKPPKATGRERFGAQFLREHRAVDALRLEDALATLTELTAASIANAIRSLPLSQPEIVVSGGGAHNRHLLSRLAARLAPDRVEISDAMGIPCDAKEAIAFAVLGYETLRERAANVPAATGARAPVVLGAIAPHGLRALFEKIEAECRS
jgi:anhydro-N-acetylmuramic acid kinase